MMARIIVSLGALALAGCAAGVPPARGPQDLQVPPAFSTRFLPPAGEDESWWRGFGEPELDALVEEALARNLDIEAALARFRAAEALLRAERSDLLPSADARASAGAEIGIGENGGSDMRSVAGAGLFGQFTPDLSGRLSAEVRAAAANLSAADYLVADQRRLVAAAVANQYIELRRTGARLELLDESTQLQEQTLRTVTLRFEAGLSPNLDVRRAAADLAQTRAQRGLLMLERARAAHALAVLSGDPPRSVPDYEGAPSGVPDFEGGPPSGSPADLLRRRADLLVAESRLVEAAALIGVERSDLLPSLVIPGDISTGGGSVSDLFSDFLVTLGAALDIPLFDGGRRRAEIAAAEAEADARFAQYRQTFLGALGEVENALVAIEAFRNRSEELRKAIDESETAFGQSNALYREGLTSLFDVLDAQRQLIASREALIDSEASLASSITALYAAVGVPG